MRECPTCGAPVRLPTGARCRRCRQPLYERGRGPRLVRPEERSRYYLCQWHPDHAAVGKCAYCRALICRVCCTPWRRRDLCLDCAERALREKEQQTASPAVGRRRALGTVLLGLLAWLALASALGLGLLHPAGELSGVLSFWLAIGGLGQGLWALRQAARPSLLHLMGLILCAACLGIWSSTALLFFWQL